MQVTFQDAGWAYLPLFELLENENGTYSIFINSGLHSVRRFLNNANHRYRFGRDLFREIY